uniref:CLU central domain-containing protein n=1 Tax=Romanomermis culicivorax TaxID=13658 RepID=A0A915K1V3_ROMCU
IRDCLDHTFLPLDGCSLTEALHNRGINIRYLGKLTQLIDNLPSLQYLKTICSLELLCRSAKRLFRHYLCGLGKNSRRFSYAAAHFLNCFLGANAAPPPLNPNAQDQDLLARGPFVQKTGGKKRGGADKKKTSAAAAASTLNVNGGVVSGADGGPVNILDAYDLDECKTTKSVKLSRLDENDA